ncbi:conjugal transfer protein TrbI [Klebsiella variicola]|uniref:Conjugal transfer protein TrbI n=1 Tax=Klebsiella variicola TaxID=244366 RepID=A0A7H4N3P9_KLEVA|nr:conjugal transfer protein TrbI [Klebsiella variicola]
MKNNTEQPVSTTSHTFRRIPVIVALVLFALATSRVSLARGSGVLHAAGGGF